MNPAAKKAPATKKTIAAKNATAKVLKPPVASGTKSVSFDCLPIVQGPHTLYFFSATAEKLWPIVEINTKHEDKDEGYQRVLSQSRVRSIATYIGNKRPLPLSILVTFTNATVSKDGRTLTVPNLPDAGWVIDGQHRLAGAHEAKANVELPVVAFVGLDTVSQIQQFITINREAKGVPTSLYYDLLKHVPNKKPQEIAQERAANLANDLRRDEDSPFFGKIVITSTPAQGELSLNNFVRKVGPLVSDSKGILSVYSATEQVQILANYYGGLKNAFPKEFNKPNSIFFQTLGFGALINALPLFLNLCIKHYAKFRVEDVTRGFREIRHFDFSGWSRFGTGSAAELQAGEDLQSELNSAFNTIKSGGTIQLQ